MVIRKRFELHKKKAVYQVFKDNELEWSREIEMDRSKESYYNRIFASREAEQVALRLAMGAPIVREWELGKDNQEGKTNEQYEYGDESGDSFDGA